MGKLIAFEFLSIDGFMAGPPGREMDFVVSAFGEDMERDLAAQYAELDALVMGGTTFRELSGYWPTPAAADEPLQPVMNRIQKLLVSRSPDKPRWNNSRLLGADPISGLREIKHSASGDMMVIGSASVVQALARERLIDEFRFFVFPTFLGAGKPLLTADSMPGSLELLRTNNFASGVVRTDYQVAGHVNCDAPNPG